MENLLVVGVVIAALLAVLLLMGLRKGRRVRAMVKNSPQLPPDQLRAMGMSVLAKLVEQGAGKDGYVAVLPALTSLKIRPMSREHVDVTTYLLGHGFVVEKSGEPVLVNVMVTDAGRAARDAGRSLATEP
ncbi:hypothetical protein GCE86_30700 [Micromonospora terminaliae]|uniref:Uncharacterized protein n=1 Tax=Micromonospora terminaliae TaxID=1914461 RepID=A0AAJ2ZC32_9ACTN|nr:hypothetical protein [Micromonospora terminaliae]NES26871.1 hypothetical protein [Micromonospora terminaliae]QGL51022.1 hypothetical protein GCE86_30700 [Micromonospora terminaliae]